MEEEQELTRGESLWLAGREEFEQLLALFNRWMNRVERCNPYWPLTVGSFVRYLQKKHTREQLEELYADVWRLSEFYEAAKDDFPNGSLHRGIAAYGAAYWRRLAPNGVSGHFRQLSAATA